MKRLSLLSCEDTGEERILKKSLQVSYNVIFHPQAWQNPTERSSQWNNQTKLKTHSLMSHLQVGCFAVCSPSRQTALSSVSLSDDFHSSEGHQTREDSSVSVEYPENEPRFKGLCFNKAAAFSQTVSHLLKKHSRQAPQCTAGLTELGKWLLWISPRDATPKYLQAGASAFSKQSSPSSPAQVCLHKKNFWLQVIHGGYIRLAPLRIPGRH